ncbi:nucleotide exchange factor GrpE [Herbiconiux sp. CPCC 203407]|uniref:Protein GrpE n=1 Tax=Herbiconiux oxytropis TaxID=2970915 RepID=A0AA42BSW9_9MICO|nr:nucleotide exchange factor GrpE [Herbiconiux oxytropis]MCS5722976.1 nucleotide exchange factor GrpE [Herbiconiux oxytropis]MCS5725212.1 nucleotide exchange factor GrpE [Herbiconiux oxytropis]
MTDDKDTGRQPDDESGASSEETPDSGFIEAEGPDVETSLTDADLSFLSGQSSADELAAERLADLQRVTAEYANYRKRTEANREVDKERAVGEVVKVLLPVLDDLDRAAKHGDLEEGGPFTAIAAKLRSGVERVGLKPFAAPGEEFDPQIHEAIFQQPSDDVTAPVIADVVESGYYLGSSLLRAAKVVVAVPNG